MTRRTLFQFIIGVIVGLIVDYFIGEPIIATIIAVAIASLAAGSLRGSLTIGIVTGLVWLTIAYIITGVMTPGAFSLISLTVSIAGLSSAMAYGILYILVLIVSASVAAIVYKGSK